VVGAIIVIINLCQEKMAVNTNKRIAVKWVRDRAKKAYEKQTHCYICNTTTELELHHTHSITRLLENWAAKNAYDISTDSGILAVRDEFIEQHHSEIYDQVYTLCNRHHVQLHGVYGKSPSEASCDRQTRWIEIQKSKYNNGTAVVGPSYGSFFSQFLKE
jgi:5-methylcytosine-specific restriction endonuclease McrA